MSASPAGRADVGGVENVEAGRLLAVCRVHGLRDDDGGVGVTAIDKRPTAGPVRVRRLGLYGDIQADRAHHGGESKALYAYGENDARHWEKLLGRPVVPGEFGENLRVSGLDVNEAVIGERWLIGATVEAEVTCPRTPCATFGRYMNEPRWVRRFTAEGRVGAYLRVRTTGDIAAGDVVRILSRPSHGVSVAAWFRGRSLADVEALRKAADAGQFDLAPELVTAMEKVFKSAGRVPTS